MDLSVVVVNWNSGSYLGRLLASLEPLADELKDIWVVDNASKDSSLLAVQQHPFVKVLPLERNQGFSGGANEGFARISSPFGLLLNPDIEVVPETIRKLYLEIERHGRAALVCGSLRDETGAPQDAFQIRRFPSWKSVLCDVLFVDELGDWIRVRRGDPASGSKLHPDARPGESHWRLRLEQPAAAFWLVRKRAWQDLEGFDPQFHPAWFEDVDFCKRLLSTDWEVLFFPELPIIHRGGLCLDRLGYSGFVPIFYGNLLKYLKKHSPRAYPFLWGPVRFGVWVRRHFVKR